MKTKQLVICSFLLAIAASLLGQSEFFNMPKQPQALGKSAEDLQKEYPSRKGDVVFLYNLAKGLYEAGDYGTAQGYITEARDLDPTNPWILLYAGRIHYKLGEEEQAAQAWQKALETRENYEFLPVWEELVIIRPQYLANIGLLYRDKAKENDNKDLARKAIEYLDEYLSKEPGGVFENQAKGAKNELEIMLKKEQSEKRIANKELELKRIEMERQMELEKSRKDFRISKKRMGGMHFVSFNPKKEFEFVYEGSGSIIDSILSLEKFQVASLSSFQFTGGYLHDKWILRGGLMVGSTKIDKQFEIDSTENRAGEIVYNKKKANSAKTFLLAVQADYNFFYIDPILLYAGAGADIGRLKLDTEDYEFSQEFLAGFGIDFGIMLHFNNFLVDLNIKPNLVGSSSGTSMLIGCMYKF